MTFDPKTIHLIIFTIILAFSNAQEDDPLGVSSSKALQRVQLQFGEYFADKVVEMRGIRGQSQPREWTIVVNDERSQFRLRTVRVDSENSINEGDLKTTKTYLGRFFSLTGKVVKGDGLGKQIDYPTANISIEEDYKIIPKDGVYYIKTTIDNNLYNGMMNIGHRPTIGTKEKSIEVNLFNFDRDIYDRVISIDVVEKIRDEKKFASIEALKTQLAKDQEHCLKLINK